MAANSELDQQRAADRRLALLTLAGDQPQPEGGCCAEEEWAALVEGRLSPERREQCLAHAAACERCYGLWRQLDQLRQQHRDQDSGAKLLRLLRRPRLLAATGTLLAAAASLAVFLTITARVDRPSLVQRQEKAAQEQLLPPPAGQPPAAALEAAPEQEKRLLVNKEAKEPVSPAVPAERQARKSARATAEPQNAAEVPTGQKQRAGAEVGAEAKSDAVAAWTGGSAAPPPPAAAAAPPTPAVWQDRIRAGCSGTVDADFFNRIRMQGKEMLLKTQMPKQQRRLIERILLALERPLPAEAQCRALLEILGPAAKEN